MRLPWRRRTSAPAPLDEETGTAALRALAPLCGVRGGSWEGGVARSLTFDLPGERHDSAQRQLVALLEHPSVRPVRELSIGFFFFAAHDSPLWGLQAIAAHRLPMLEQMFVHGSGPMGLDPLASAFQQPAALGTYINGRGSSFGEGPFANVRVLDLRDAHVEWNASDRIPSWPDLEILILRPRGDREDRWVEQVLRSSGCFPKLRELRAPEHRGDEIVEALLGSPVLAQLRRIDLTGSLTNRGAALLHENAPKLEQLEEICLGTDGSDRRGLIEMASVANPRFEAPPMGELEIDDAWRSRLRQRLGRRATFDVPVGHPNLDLGPVLRGKR